MEETYETIIEQSYTTIFRSQNNHLLRPRWAVRLDPSTIPFLTHPISNVNLQTYQFLISLPILYHHTEDDKNTTPTAPHLHTLHDNHPISLLSRNYRNIALTEHIFTSHRYPQSPVTHIFAQIPNVEKNTYKQIIEQPRTTNFRSQNNHIFSPRWAARLNPSTVPFHTHPTPNVTLRSYYSLISLPTLKHHILIIHQAWIQMTLPQTQFFIPSPNLPILILKPQMKSQIPSLAHPFSPNPLSTTPFPDSRWTFLSPFFLHWCNFNFLPNDKRPSDPASRVDEQLENELDNFITPKQQLQNPNPLTNHHLSQIITSFESSNPSSTTESTRAHRVFKCKHPNAQKPPNPWPRRTFSVHPLHTNTKEFLQECLPFFPQYFYFKTNTNNDQWTYVNEHALFPSFSWTSYYHYHSHFEITQTTMNCTTLGYIT